MSLDFSNVGQTANRESEKLSVKGSGNRLSNRSLSNTRRTDEADDLAFDSSTKFSNSQELEDPIFYILQSVMVLIKNSLCVCDGVILLRVLTPRNLHIVSR